MRGFFGTRRAKSFQCDICREKFKDLESMEEHRRQVHRDAAPAASSNQARLPNPVCLGEQ